MLVKSREMLIFLALACLLSLIPASAQSGITAVSGLGYCKFIGTQGVIEVGVGGNITSGTEKPEVVYEKKQICPFVPKIRINFEPSSVGFENNTKLSVSFENSDEITKPIQWTVTLWNGTSITGTSLSYEQQIKISDIAGCEAVREGEYLCKVNAKAWIAEIENCTSSVSHTLLVSVKPEETNPYLVYEKWVEPKEVNRGQQFELHLKIEGRGFFVEGATNLGVVHVVDVSGSMIWPAIFKTYSLTVNPNVLTENITLTQNGRLEIYAYTTDRLSNWYNNSLCKCTGSACPWWNKGYDSSFIKLYVNNNEVGSAYSSGSAIGKSYSRNVQPGNYTIEVVARAPEQINLTIKVVFRGNTILEKTVPYTNRGELSFELPAGVNYKFLAVTGVQGIPNWDMSYSWFSREWSDYSRIEDYTVDGSRRYWEYCWRLCGNSYTFQDGSLNAWILLPNGSKEFLMRGENSPWYQARNNYESNGINGDAFIPNPPAGTYKFVIVPTTKNPTIFTATVLIKRIDAAKLAAIQFNNMLGEKDFVGLANFTTDAQRIVVNSSSVLKYMTSNKAVVNSIINQFRAERATDHADGLYYGSRVFPVWNETGNNCTDCISGLRPLIVMLTDGEPTICNLGANYYGCVLCNQKCDGSNWCEPCKNQALCIANYLKSMEINDFNISICTIGFSTDIGSRGQEFLRQLASPRPDNNESCYFFATTSEELVEAYRTIFNAFQIAAKQIIVYETVNISKSSPFELISVEANSNKGTQLEPVVTEYEDKTVITLNITSIQKDEVIELVVTLKVKDDAPEGEYKMNIEGSFIEYTALNNQGEEIGRITLPIVSDKDKVKITKGGQPFIGFG